MVRIKICGITGLEDARCAALAGANMLGFIFYPKSARYVAPSQAGEIIQAIRDELGAEAPTMVGVFVDAPLSTLRIIAAESGLDLLQLHGSEPPEIVRALGGAAFKAVAPRTWAEAEGMMATYLNGEAGPALPHPPVSRSDRRGGDQLSDKPDLLVDAYAPMEHGGTGHRVERTLARQMASQCKLLLAGGLTPQNVSAAIREINPWGVDVSSGVEAQKGIKDHDLIHAFTEAVRRTAS
jgi:phosphoribosylanthranilate isomerase